MATINVTTGTGSATVTVSTGARGPAGAAGPGTNVTVSTTPPTNPDEGDKWIDSESMVESVWYDDGTDGGVWVQTSGDTANATSSDLAPVAVADSTERKLAATYTALDITPTNGMRVIQDDLPDVVWTLLNVSDITDDDNWHGQPRTNASGQLPLSGVTLQTDTGYLLKAVKNISQARVRNRVAHVLVVGDVTDGTYLTVTVTGPPANGGVAKNINVTVAAGDTAPEWQDKVVTALNADTDFNPHYAFYACGGVIQMQEVVLSASDVFSVNIAVGDTTGVTAKSSNQTQQNAFVSCGTVVIPAALVNTTQKFTVFGRIEAAVGSVDTSSTNYIAFRPRMAGQGTAMTATTFGTYLNPTIDATNGGFDSVLNLAAAGKFLDTGGKLRWSMTAADTDSAAYAAQETIRIRSSNAITQSTKAFVATSGISEAPVAENCELELICIFAISPTGAAGKVVSDISILPVDAWN